MQNGFMESLNGKMRDECLNEHVFGSLAEARRIIEAWRIDYNEVRPHSSLGYQTPDEFAAAWPPAGEKEKPPAATSGAGNGPGRSDMWDRHAEGVHWHDAPGRCATASQGAKKEQIQVMTGGKMGSRSTGFGLPPHAADKRRRDRALDKTHQRAPDEARAGPRELRARYLGIDLIAAAAGISAA